jgi:hypothetical protein
MQSRSGPSAWTTKQKADGTTYQGAGHNRGQEVPERQPEASDKKANEGPEQNVSNH